MVDFKTSRYGILLFIGIIHLMTGFLICGINIGIAVFIAVTKIGLGIVYWFFFGGGSISYNTISFYLGNLIMVIGIVFIAYRTRKKKRN